MLTLPSYHSILHFDPSGDSAHYRAVRASDGAPVVLKVLAAGVACVVDRARLKHEYKQSLYSDAFMSDVLPYLSPEQTGRMNRSVDHRSDLYSLGVLFYRMLTGGLPFEASDPLELIHAPLPVGIEREECNA
ncbi:hypothetical protein ACMHYB_37580 [Sorangium sp. So ce1128]